MRYRRPVLDVDAMLVTFMQSGEKTERYWLIERPDGTQEQMSQEQFTKEGFTPIQQRVRTKAIKKTVGKGKVKLSITSGSLDENALIGKAHED